MRVHSAHLAGHPAAVAGERMDDTPDWRLLEPGELLHAGPDLRVTHDIALPDPPAHRLTLDDPHPAAAASRTAA